jgi:hypothetical protein
LAQREILLLLPARDDASIRHGRRRGSRHKRLNRVQVLARVSAIGPVWIKRAGGRGHNRTFLERKFLAIQAIVVHDIFDHLVAHYVVLPQLAAVKLTGAAIEALPGGAEDSLEGLETAGVGEKLLLQVSGELLHDSDGGLQGGCSGCARQRRAALLCVTQTPRGVLVRLAPWTLLLHFILVFDFVQSCASAIGVSPGGMQGVGRALWEADPAYGSVIRVGRLLVALEACVVAVHCHDRRFQAVVAIIVGGESATNKGTKKETLGDD